MFLVTVREGAFENEFERVAIEVLHLHTDVLVTVLAYLLVEEENAFSTKSHIAFLIVSYYVEVSWSFVLAVDAPVERIDFIGNVCHFILYHYVLFLLDLQVVAHIIWTAYFRLFTNFLKDTMHVV